MEKAANSNQDAYVSIDLAVSYFHQFDDLVDGDTEFNARNFVKVNNLLTRLLTSKFFCENRGVLLAQILLIGDDYIASVESPEYWDRLRHNGNNFIRLIALITGGENLFIEVSKELRDFSVKDQILKKD